MAKCGFIILNSFAWLLLAAHYSRADNILFMILSLLIPLLFLIRKRWALLSLQIVTYAGSLVWIQSTIEYARQRSMSGESWTRLAVILVSVAVFTFITGLLLNSRKMKAVYR